VSTDNITIRESLRHPTAFGKVFDRHAQAIFRYAARRAGEHIGQDILSETFLIAFEKRGTYDLA
jgi:DNA-directed RNA polymerase specialized sigma24 family protein